MAKKVCKKCGSKLKNGFCMDETCPYSNHPQPYEGGFKEIVVKSKKVKGLSVFLSWDCGEGVCGDYDPEDDDDVPLLRFDVIYGKDPEQVENGSYCTQLEATDDRRLLVKAAQTILKEAENSLSVKEDGTLERNGFKRTMEWLSWIQVKDGKLV